VVCGRNCCPKGYSVNKFQRAAQGQVFRTALIASLHRSCSGKNVRRTVPFPQYARKWDCILKSTTRGSPQHRPSARDGAPDESFSPLPRRWREARPPWPERSALGRRTSVQGNQRVRGGRASVQGNQRVRSGRMSVQGN
jgi:hypothetical protein